MLFGYNGRDGVITDENSLLYMRARYYSPDLHRFVNADVIPGEISNAITLNRFAYANGNPVSFVDPFGLWSLREAWNGVKNWVEEKVVEPVSDFSTQVGEAVVDFFDPDSHKLDGDVRKGLFYASGSVSGGNLKNDSSPLDGKVDLKDLSENKGMTLSSNAGVSANIASAEGEVGIGNKNLSLSVKGNVDVLAAEVNANQSFNFSDGFGVGIGAKASVLSASTSINLNVLGVEFSYGISGDLLGAGFDFTAGIIKNLQGKREIGINKEFLFGVGGGTNFSISFP